MGEQRRTRVEILAATRVKLARHAKLRHDPVQDRWILLVPEKVLHPTETALEALRLCDGQRNVSDVANALAAIYEAPPDAILADIIPLLQDLADKGYVTT
jgi:pyrroloquinoline quinone biosynthesis protein D